MEASAHRNQYATIP